MATRVISTSIKLDGEAEFKRQMSNVNSELKTLRSEMAYSEEAFKGQANTMEALTEKDRLLRKEIEQQEEKVRALEQAVRESSEAFGDNDKRTDSWRQSLNRAKTELIKMNRELEDTDQYLDEAKRSADKTADSIDGFGREVKGAGDDLGGIGGGIGDFMGKLDSLKGMLVGGGVVVGIKELTGAILEVEESTREYRQIMGTLETSSAKAGYTAEQTSEAYQRLYGVLGDTQTAATTVANLQAIGLSQEDLMVIIDQATGAWATYGDSIPIDGLSESINETIQAGQVTGVFADVLNWAGTSEDDFNEKLAATKDSTERANIVLLELAKQGLGSTGRAWRENNEDIVKMNEAQSELQEAMGRMGELLAPLAADLINFGADAIGFVVDKVKAAVDWFTKWNNTLNETGVKLSDIPEGRVQYEKVDGSNAGGLSYVPFDGYISELHRGEAVLTAQENRVWQQFKAGGYQPQQGVTAEQLQAMLVGTVNALNSQRGGSIPQEIDLRLKTDDGQTMGRWLVPFVRSEDKSNPEVVSDV